MPGAAASVIAKIGGATRIVTRSPFRVRTLRAGEVLELCGRMR